MVTSTPTRPVENVVLTTKDLQDKNIQLLDGTTVENKDKTYSRYFKCLNITPYGIKPILFRLQNVF